MTDADFVPVDHAIREQVRTRLDENLCVEAGAGTGKTTVLVDRVVALLRAGLPPERLVAITFTEKAAAELAARVRLALQEAALATTDEREQARLLQAARDLTRAHIETIHAFATSLLRERPLEAGLDPGFTVLEGVPAQLAFDEAWDAWLTAELASDTPPRALLDAMNVGLDFTYVRQAAERLHAHREALPLAPPPPAPDIGDVFAAVSRAAAELERIEPDVMNDEDAAYKAIPEYLQFARQLAAIEPSDRDALSRLLGNFRRTNPKSEGSLRNWRDPNQCRAVKRLHGAIYSAATEARDALRAAATAALAQWLTGFIAYFEQRRRDAGQADFDDLLIWARNLLRDRPDVRASFAARYERVLVDEFQDTDELQAELLVRLCGIAGDQPADWRQTRLRPGSLFVVGDPKQSIYRFRRADLAMYDEMKRHMFPDTVAIVQNFRSIPEIIDWVNGLFGQLVREQAGVQARYIDLVADPRLASGRARAVEVVVGPRERSRGRANGIPTARAAEATAVAALVRARVDDGAWIVRGAGGERPAQYRDIAVLMPTRRDIDLYEDAFARAGVPYRREGGRTFFLRQEVRDLVNVLRTLDDPTDGVAFVGALRSSAFGCSDEELFLYRTAGGRFDRRPQPYLEGVPAAVIDALHTLEELSHLHHAVPLPAFVRAVIDRTRLVESAMLQPQGEQASANLLKLIDHARAFAAAGHGGLRGFVRWLRTNIEVVPDESDAEVSEESDNVVRLLTIHAAKGLEFPVVILANTATRPPDRTDIIVSRADDRRCLVLKLGRREDGFRTPGFEDAAAAEQLHQREEELRKLYVAVTRARDHLVVPLFAPPRRDDGGKMSIDDWLQQAETQMAGERIDAQALPRFDAEPPIFRRPLEPPGERDIRDAMEARASWQHARRDRIDLASAPRRVVTATALKPAWLHELDDAPVRRGGAVDLGAAVHTALERVPLDDLSELHAIAASAAVERGLADRAAEVERLCRGALASDAVQRARRSRTVMREVGFVVPSSAGTVEGRIDLLFAEEGGLVIVDFKTDDVRGARLAEQTALYRAQALVYAWAAQAATAMPVREVVFVYARGPHEVSVPVDAQAIEEATALIERGEALELTG
jgi:ATP-dependent helicase/nuclease subunit A